MREDFWFDYEALDKHLAVRSAISQPTRKIQPPELSHYVKEVVTGGGIHWWSSLLRPLGVEGITVYPKDTNYFYTEAEKQYALFQRYQKADHWLDPHCLVGLGDEHKYLVCIDTLAYLPNPIKAMWEWNRVLKDGAKIVLMSQHPEVQHKRACNHNEIIHTFWTDKRFISGAVLENGTSLPRVHRIREYNVKSAKHLIYMTNLYMSCGLNDDNKWVQGKTKPFEVLYTKEIDDSHSDCWLMILRSKKPVKLPKGESGGIVSEDEPQEAEKKDG